MANLVAITGNTFPVKDQLKALGARWNGADKVWMVNADKADEARSLVSGKAAAATASTPDGYETEAQSKAIRTLSRQLVRFWGHADKHLVNVCPAALFGELESAGYSAFSPVTRDGQALRTKAAASKVINILRGEVSRWNDNGGAYA